MNTGARQNTANEISRVTDRLERLNRLAAMGIDDWEAIGATYGREFGEVLTAEEAVRFLRLDGPRGPRDPYQVLYRYRRQCLLKGVQIGREIMYTKEELMAFLRRKTEGNR
ncbi:MAG: helix-turn-helix domain-containing protein [Pseudomonadota bacterium]